MAVVGIYGAIRDSKNPELTTIVMPMRALRKLFDDIKKGMLDLR